MIVKELLSMLLKPERQKAYLVLALMCVMALLEAIGVASVMPFIAILVDPDYIKNSTVLSFLYDELGFTSRESFLMFTGISSFAILVFSAVVRSFTLYTQEHFLQKLRHSISSRLLGGYISQPYVYFTNRHSGDMAKNILSEVDRVIEKVFIPAGHIVSYGLVILAMVALIIVVDPITAVVIAISVGGFYMIVFLSVRRYLHRIGRESMEMNQLRFRVAAESFGAIKEIKILQRENHYLKAYETPSERLAKCLAVNSIAGQLPKFTIEAGAFGAIILLSLVMMTQYGLEKGSTLSKMLPVLGLYVFAGYRILPAAQQVYYCISSIRFGRPMISNLRTELENCAPASAVAPSNEEAVTFEKTLSLQDATYHYPNSQGVGITDVTFEIAKGTTVGIVGSTGAGKTTLVDVMLGLLVPESGQISIDGKPLDASNRAAWQRKLGYVPQDIYLTDSTIYENVALGRSPDEIDRAAVEKCCQIAQIHDFIVNELPEGYQTVTGEGGIRLSGGQRQRLGIARALYHNPDVIVFDEATSALDNLTEAEVMRAINILSGLKTVILIAHRLSTVEQCDNIILLDRGRLAGSGTYEQLLESNDKFKAFINPRQASQQQGAAEPRNHRMAEN